MYLIYKYYVDLTFSLFKNNQLIDSTNHMAHTKYLSMWAVKLVSFARMNQMMESYSIRLYIHSNNTHCITILLTMLVKIAESPMILHTD